jgi:hypothetical protein
VVVVVVAAGVVVVVVFSSLLQPASSASAASDPHPASWTKDRFESRVMVAPVVIADQDEASPGAKRRLSAQLSGAPYALMLAGLAAAGAATRRRRQR